MMMKKMEKLKFYVHVPFINFYIILIFGFIIAIINHNSSTNTSNNNESNTEEANTTKEEDKDEENEQNDVIELSGNTITDDGTYKIVGESENIIINTKDSVELVLENATIKRR